MKRVLIVALILVGIVGCMGGEEAQLGETPAPATETPAPPPSTVGPVEIKSSDFNMPEKCKTCHPEHYEQWLGSMHAYSFMDPVFWSLHDIGQNETEGEMAQFCSQCHSPIASVSGETKPFFMAISPLGLRGISCEACHKITGIKEPFTGGFEIAPGDAEYGSIKDPRESRFHVPAYSEIYSTSEYCGTCHDVIVDGLGLELTYTEWKESEYAERGITCQKCHMKSYRGQAAVGGPERELHEHYMAGVDVALIKFPDAEKQASMVEELLRNAVTFEVTAPDSVAGGEVVSIEVRITNDKTGHAVPSDATHDRQMWIAVTLSDANGGMIYQSGQLDANSDLMDHNSELNESADEDLVLFNSVLYDEDGKETHFLHRAKSMEARMIYPMETKTARYEVELPEDVEGDLKLDVKLRYRTFPPFHLRKIGVGELVEKLPIVDMAAFEKEIEVS